MRNFWTVGLALCLMAGEVQAGAWTFQRGTLDGAKYTIVAPVKWNGRLLLLAHGQRGEEAPLVSDFEITEGSYLAGLIKLGWIVGSTSFRRNGWITRDAVEDIEALRQKIVAEYGAPKLTVVVGTSMGGAIGTMIAETADAKNYQGVLAVSAELDEDKFSEKPHIPLLFLSNQDEATDPGAYVTAAASASPAPALWTVSRDGHGNITQAEYKAVVRDFLKFVESGKVEPNKDVTIAGSAPASGAVITGRTAEANVTGVEMIYGNILTDMVPEDLEKIGLKKGAAFTISHGDAKATGRWVTAYANVPKGDWLSLVTADGRVLFARNLANAAETLGVKAGDRVTVSPTE